MKEGGTKFFHALVYYGQKRESVLTLKPSFTKKQIPLIKYFRINSLSLIIRQSHNDCGACFGAFFYTDRTVMQAYNLPYQ